MLSIKMSLESLGIKLNAMSAVKNGQSKTLEQKAAIRIAPNALIIKIN